MYQGQNYQYPPQQNQQYYQHQQYTQPMNTYQNDVQPVPTTPAGATYHHTTVNAGGEGGHIAYSEPTAPPQQGGQTNINCEPNGAQFQPKPEGDIPPFNPEAVDLSQMTYAWGSGLPQKSGFQKGDGFWSGFLGKKINILQVLLSLGVVGGIILLLVTSNFVVGVVIAVICYILTIIFTVCSSQWKYIGNPTDLNKLQMDLTRLKNTAPRIVWTIQNYHYVTRRSYDHQRKTYTTHRERINTHYAKQDFIFTDCIDESPNQDEFLRNPQYLLTKLKCNLNIQFADQYTAMEYHRQEHMFRMMHTTDVYHDFHCEYKLPGMIKKSLIEAEPGNRSALMSRNFMFLSALVGMVSCYTGWFEGKVGKYQFWFQKKVRVQPVVLAVPVIAAPQPVAPISLSVNVNHH